MKTKTITLYSFDELSEEAKEKALQNLCNINVDHQWWEYLYDDAKTISLQITGFDTNHYCKGKLMDSLYPMVNAIIENHGKECSTYKTAQEFKKQWEDLVAKYSDGEDIERVSEENIDHFDPLADELESEFLKSLLEDYRILLRNEYEYLTSREAIIETIKANEYTFTESGKLEN